MAAIICWVQVRHVALLAKANNMLGSSHIYIALLTEVTVQIMLAFCVSQFSVVLCWSEMSIMFMSCVVETTYNDIKL